VKKNSPDPEWNLSFVFPLTELVDVSAKLNVTVLDKALLTHDDIIGASDPLSIKKVLQYCHNGDMKACILKNASSIDFSPVGPTSSFTENKNLSKRANFARKKSKSFLSAKKTSDSNLHGKGVVHMKFKLLMSTTS